MIVVVAGLPRSGTSMMMRMLDIGGLECVRDESHAPLEHYETVQGVLGGWTSADLRSWQGKAVKILFGHVVDLPPGDYRVIVMRRDFDAILKSAASLQLATQTWQAELDVARSWAEEYPHIEVWYEDVLYDPVLQCRRIERLLGRELIVGAMVCVVRC